MLDVVEPCQTEIVGSPVIRDDVLRILRINVLGDCFVECSSFAVFDLYQFQRAATLTDA